MIPIAGTNRVTQHGASMITMDNTKTISPIRAAQPRIDGSKRLFPRQPVNVYFYKSCLLVFLVLHCRRIDITVRAT